MNTPAEQAGGHVNTFVPKSFYSPCSAPLKLLTFVCFRPVPALPYRPPKTQECWDLDMWISGIRKLHKTERNNKNILVFALIIWTRVCWTFWTTGKVTVQSLWKNRGWPSHLGATPLKGALLSSLRYSWTIYLFIIKLLLCRMKNFPEGEFEKTTKIRSFLCFTLFCVFFLLFLFLLINAVIKDSFETIDLSWVMDLLTHSNLNENEEKWRPAQFSSIIYLLFPFMGFSKPNVLYVFYFLFCLKYEAVMKPCSF